MYRDSPPFFLPPTDSPTQDNSCFTPTEQVCNIASSTGPTHTTETTPTNPPTATPATGSRLSSAEAICIVIAGIVLILHIITIILCAVNLAVMKRLTKVLKSRTVMPVTPGIRSSSTFNLGPIGGRKIASPMGASPTPYAVINSATPAEYEAVQHNPLPPDQHETLDPPGFYETVPGERRLQFQDEKGHSLNNKSNSRTGSTEDLLEK